jgi:hypothetical protein
MPRVASPFALDQLLPVLPAPPYGAAARSHNPLARAGAPRGSGQPPIKGQSLSSRVPSSLPCTNQYATAAIATPRRARPSTGFPRVDQPPLDLPHIALEPEHSLVGDPHRSPRRQPNHGGRRRFAPPRELTGAASTSSSDANPPKVSSHTSPHSYLSEAPPEPPEFRRAAASHGQGLNCVDFNLSRDFCVNQGL